MGEEKAPRDTPTRLTVMRSRTKLLLTSVVVLGSVALAWSAQFPNRSWIGFSVLMIAVLASSGFKVMLPQGDGTMSLNFPFILLAIIQLSPLQALLISALSVLVQCRFRVMKLFTNVQVAFNVSNVIVSTALAYVTFTFSRHALTVAPAIAIAAVVYFLSSTACVALVIAWTKREKPWMLWKEQFPWYLPFYLVGAGLAATADLIGRSYGWLTSMLMIPVVYILYRSYTAQVIRSKERQQHLEETEALHLRTIEGLAMAIEAKDRNTHDHLFRVRTYASEIGKVFGFDKAAMQALQTAAFLHDIGKLAVPEHIINKPGKLTPEEFEKMKIHPVVGADILERVRFPYPVVPIVRSHHEWWNGSGYPDGLKGEEIPIGARILSAVDCFDALASDRPYRRRLPVAEAMAVVKSMAGVQFDPEVVEVLEHYFLASKIQAESAVHGDFQPLDTDVNVWRGEAPAAGFARTAALKESASFSMTQLDTSRSFDSLNRIAAASQEAQALFEMSQSIGNSLSLSETISVIISRLHRLMPFHCCALFVRNGDVLIPQRIEGDGAKSFSAEPIALGEGISGWVALSGKPMLNGNPEVEPTFRGSQGGPDCLKSALSIPLVDLNERVFAVLTLYACTEDAFSRDHLRLLQVMETKLSLSLQNALHFGRAANDAETDFLTSLPNARRLFLQLETELERCRRAGTELGVIVCDLNSFKEVNDQHGHLAGNALLGVIAGEFRQSSKPSETVARMGGDEFVFLVPAADKNQVAQKLKLIAQDVEKAVRRRGLDIAVSASLGFAMYPSDARTAEELLALADRRMYLDKAVAAPVAADGISQAVA